MKKQMKQFNLTVERISAIDGNSLTHPSKNPLQLPPKYWNKYALGLLHTLNKIIQDARDKKYKQILIFEDDVILHKDFHTLLEKYMKLLPNIWDVVQLSGANHRVLPTYVTPNLFKTSHTLGTYAMLIHSRCFEDLIRVTSWELGPADDTVRILQKRGNCYMFYPGIVVPKAGYSDIIGKNIDYTKILHYETSPIMEKIIFNQRMVSHHNS